MTRYRVPNPYKSYTYMYPVDCDTVYTYRYTGYIYSLCPCILLVSAHSRAIDG
jgi:hypothetical protein